jgi:hypothetical protein
MTFPRTWSHRSRDGGATEGVPVESLVARPCRISEARPNPPRRSTGHPHGFLDGGRLGGGFFFAGFLCGFGATSSSDGGGVGVGLLIEDAP